MKSFFRVVCMITLGAGLGFSEVPPVLAQQTAGEEFTLEEITVTAERRNTELQTLASSVSVQNGDEMLQQGRSSLNKVLEDVPGVAINLSDYRSLGSDSQGLSVTIRGAMPNTGEPGNSLPVVPSTAVYTDGIYEGVGGSYDLNRVEILRGPQGTLYGRSATGGVVAIHTNDPVLGSYQGTVSADIGNYGKQDIQAALSVPATDNFAIRMAGHYNKRDGYFSREGDGNTETKEGRIKALYKPNEDLSVLLGAAVQYNRTRTSGYINLMTGPDKYSLVQAPYAIGKGRNHYQQYWAQIDWNIGIGTLTYQPAFRKWYQKGDNNNAMAGWGPGAYGYSPTYQPKDDFWTHELRLASNDGSPVTWQTGVFYYNNQVRFSDALYLQPIGAFLFGKDITKETKNIGAFAEGTYPLSDTLRLTAGLRYDYTHVATAQTYRAGNEAGRILSLYLGGDAGKKKFYNTTYKLRLEKDLTPSSLLYGSISTGFLPGDLSMGTAYDASKGGKIPTVYKYSDETLTAYEIGSKNRFLNNTFQLNGAVYFYDYGGYQCILNTTTDALNPFTMNFRVVSETAQMWGGEVETLFQITGRDRLSAMVSYVHGEFTDPDALFRSLVSQKEFTGIAPWKATLGYDRMFDLPGGSILTLHGDARLQSGYDVAQVQPKMAAAGYQAWAQNDTLWLGNMNLAWTSPNSVYSITGYVRNLADKQYKVNAPGNLSSPADLASASALLSDPRTFGVVLSLKY